jgi:hypothetical protein
MDDHKLVMISIFWIFKTWERCNFFNENMFGNFLGFGRRHENHFFWKGKLIWKFLRFFLKNIFNFFKNISEKTGYFNTRFLFYSVYIYNLILCKIGRKIFEKITIFFKGFLKFFKNFFVFLKEIYNIILYIN